MQMTSRWRVERIRVGLQRMHIIPQILAAPDQASRSLWSTTLDGRYDRIYVWFAKADTNPTQEDSFQRGIRQPRRTCVSGCRGEAKQQSRFVVGRLEQQLV
jgi:hypothetical protein